jgi:uncharacterized protein YijF (DUF1287 family)
MKFTGIIALTFLFLNCKKETFKTEITQQIEWKNEIKPIENPTDFYEKLSNAAISIIDPEVIYTPSYVGIKYPNGDVLQKRVFVLML